MDLIAWFKALGKDAASAAEAFVAFLPKLLGAALLMLAGWVAARILRQLSIRLLNLIDRAWYRWVLRAGVVPSRHPPVEVVGGIVFWAVILFVVTMAADLLGLTVFAHWLGRLVEYLPTLFAGGLIVLAGVLVSGVARDLVTTASASAGMSQGPILGRAVQFSVLAAALVIGADQVGINTTFLVVLTGIVFGSIAVALAVAFGLGARTHVANLIAARQVAQLYQVGDRVRIGEWQGAIADIGAAGVVLEYEGGRIAVPAAQFLEQASVLVLGDGGGAGT